MKEILYAIYCDDELIYIGKVKDSAEAMMDEMRRLGREKQQGTNDMYDYLANRERNLDYDVHMIPLHSTPGMEVEEARRALVYSLRPFGNWSEWHWLEEEEERERLGAENSPIKK